MVGTSNGYDMSVMYHPSKEIVMVDALCRLSMGGVAHIKDGKKELVKEVHNLTHLGVRLNGSNDGIHVQNGAKLSLVAEVKAKQDMDPIMIEFSSW